MAPTGQKAKTDTTAAMGMTEPMATVVAAYAISKFASDAWGGEVGIFLSALAMTAGGNGYARWVKRPGALVRLPGIIVLVPGSASLRGMLDLVQRQDVNVGQAATLGVIHLFLASGVIFLIAAAAVWLAPRPKQVSMGASH